MSLRIALVGCGSMGFNHARVIATGARTPSSPSSSTPTRPRAAGRPSCTTPRWAAELDGLGGVDAAVVAAPTEHHHSPALPIIDAGLPLLIEKPVCPSVVDTEEVVTASEKAGMPLMCGLLERFNPAVVVAIGMLEEPLLRRAPSGTRRTPPGSRPGWPGTSSSTTSTW